MISMNISPADLLAQYQTAVTLWPFLADVESEHGLPPFLLIALGSRETGLQPKYAEGQVHADDHGWGLFGADDRWNSLDLPAFASDPLAQATLAARTIADHLRDGSLIDAVNAYGPSAGRPAYGLDVLARRQYLADHAGGSPMQFVSRSEWGARPADTSTNITPVGVAVHWEGPHMGTPDHGECAGLLRGIQAFHMDGNGWADIAYSAVACPHGYVFEGRGPGHRTAANGTNEANQSWYAVCFLGGEGDTFTAEARDAINDAIDWLGGGRVTGHRDHTSTACPGDEIYAWVQAGHPRSGNPDPNPGPAPVPAPQPEPIQEDGMKLIAVTDRGIFLAGENVGDDGRIPSRHVGTPEEVTDLVESGAIVNYDKRPELPAAVFDKYYRVVPAGAD